MVERRDTQAYGMGTIIVSPYMPGSILAIEERQHKEATGRQIGELSVPLETEVVQNGVPESPIQVVRASLAEVLNDADLKVVSDNFSVARIGEIYVPSRSTSGVHFRSALVIYTGDPEYGFTPTVGEEVTNPHWVPVGTFFSDRENVRPLASEVVVYSAVQGDLLNRRRTSKQLFPEGYSLAGLQNARDQHSDRIIRKAS